LEGFLQQYFEADQAEHTLADLIESGGDLVLLDSDLMQ
jgi:hypothetical protein